MSVSSDTLRLAMVEEVTPGTTPATPTLDLIRTVGEGLTYEVTTTQSAEMGGINRGVKDNILTGATVTGDISFELSKHVALEEFLAAGLGNVWGGDPLSVPGSDPDSVYDASDHRTFTIEKRFTMDDTPTYNYHVFRGCLVDTVTIDITPNEPITGSFGFIGNDMATSAVPLGANPAANYNSAGTAPVMTAPLVTGIELLSPFGTTNDTGVPSGTPVAWLANSCFTGLTLNLLNNGRGLQCIGTLGNSSVVLGKFEGTATGTLYYSSDEPLDALVTQEEFALVVTCTDDVGDSLEFFFPRVSFSTASVLATGTNTDVMTEITLQMLEYQDTNVGGVDFAYTAMITRSAAATAVTTGQLSPNELGAPTDDGN